MLDIFMDIFMDLFIVVSTDQKWLGSNKIQMDSEVFTVWVEFRCFLWGKRRSYQNYNPTTFLIYMVSLIDCEKLTVKHLFGKPNMTTSSQRHTACNAYADSERFARGGPTQLWQRCFLFCMFFSVYEGREDPYTTKSEPSLARQWNTF